MFDLAGDDTISFGLGEPDFQPPKVAIDAFHQAMLDGHNKYTTTAGLPALREQIAHSWNFYQAGLDQSNVCITMSGTNALLNLFLTLVNPGENVLLPELNSDTCKECLLGIAYLLQSNHTYSLIIFTQ